MNNADIWKLAARILGLDGNPAALDAVEKILSSPGFPTDMLVYKTSNHYVLPAIWHQLEKYHLLHYFPEEYRTHLEKIFRINTDRNLRIIAQAEELSDCLAGEGIQPVYLKGTAHLLDGLYPHPGWRMVGDIDLLVPEKDYLRTAELFLSLGYVDESKTYDDYLTMKHYPRLFRMDVPADVEIHRLPVPTRYGVYFSPERVLADKTAVTGRRNMFTPSDEHKIIHNFIHCQLSNGSRRYFLAPLRDLSDLFLLSQRTDPGSALQPLDWQTAARSYVALMEEAFVPEKRENRTSHSDRQVRRYHHRLFRHMNHPRIHRQYIFMVKFRELVVNRYFLRIVRAFFQKSSRDHILNRLKDPKWYRMHWKGVRQFLR